MWNNPLVLLLKLSVFLIDSVMKNISWLYFAFIYTTVQKFVVSKIILMFLKEVSYAQQGCISFIITTKMEIL